MCQGWRMETGLGLVFGGEGWAREPQCFPSHGIQRFPSRGTGMPLWERVSRAFWMASPCRAPRALCGGARDGRGLPGPGGTGGSPGRVLPRPRSSGDSSGVTRSLCHGGHLARRAPALPPRRTGSLIKKAARPTRHSWCLLPAPRAERRPRLTSPISGKTKPPQPGGFPSPHISPPPQSVPPPRDAAARLWLAATQRCSSPCPHVPHAEAVAAPAFPCPFAKPGLSTSHFWGRCPPWPSCPPPPRSPPAIPPRAAQPAGGGIRAG